MNADEDGKEGLEDERDPETFAVIGAAMEVRRQLGHGFLENVYQEALAVEFQSRGIAFWREKDLGVWYKGKALPCMYKADFICYGTLLVELKALKPLTSREFAQVINDLKATRTSKALLFNFGAPRLQYKRVILSHSYLRPSASSADSSPILSANHSPYPSADNLDFSADHESSDWEVSGG